MYYLNKFAREIFGSDSKEEVRSKREILGMTLIEYVVKVKSTFGIWTGMNIEIVSKYNKKVANTGNYTKDYKTEIEFFSLPYEVVNILSDKEISTAIYNIGEFRILNLVLSQNYTRIVEDANRLLKIILKPNWFENNHEKKFLEDYFRTYKNRRRPLETINIMLKLYALIEGKINREIYK